jgi:hypothetical protein
MHNFAFAAAQKGKPPFISIPEGLALDEAFILCQYCDRAGLDSIALCRPARFACDVIDESIG